MTVRAVRVPRVGTLALLAVAEFMLTLDLSIVNVALPAIGSDLGFGADSLQWVVNGYALAFAGFLLLGGRAADLFGGRHVFLGALSVFASRASRAAQPPARWRWSPPGSSRVSAPGCCPRQP